LKTKILKPTAVILFVFSFQGEVGMDECHVCGKPAAGEGIVEGVRVSLCEICSSYASSFAFHPEYQDFVQKKKFEKTPSYASQSQKIFHLSSPKPKVEGELAENYGKRIMQARDKKGLSRKELAQKIFIQEKELEGFEQQKFKPNETTVKKLEFALGITLTEAVE
jgi:putative transcription factor